MGSYKSVKNGRTFEIEHSCGHVLSHFFSGDQILGGLPVSYKTSPCPSCVWGKIANPKLRRQDASAFNSKLTGSDKQVVWATKIREAAIKSPDNTSRVEERIAKFALTATSKVGSEKAAAWVKVLDDAAANAYHEILSTRESTWFISIKENIHEYVMTQVEKAYNESKPDFVSK